MTTPHFRMKWKVVGLRVEPFQKDCCRQLENGDFNEYSELSNVYVFFLQSATNQKYELTLFEKEGRERESISTWTSACWGRHRLDEVKVFSIPTHLPRTKLEHVLWEIEPPDPSKYTDYGYGIQEPFLSFSENGGNFDYPEGFVDVELDMFDLLILS